MNISRKKCILAIGTSITTAAPIIGAVSCSWLSDKNVNHYDLLPTYTGQADQLIALGIKPDYYPLQLDAKKPYDYLTNPRAFLQNQSEDFRRKFEAKINTMMSGIPKGTSWWNQQALDSGEKGSDPSYWQRQSADVLMYEHYLLDDDSKVIDSSIAPKHDEARTIQTNFRWSRDPYTRLSKGVIFGLDKVDMSVVNGKLIWAWQNNQRPDPWDATINGETCRVTSDDIEIIQKFIDDNVDSSGKGSWIYNSKFFAYIFHVMYLDNDDFSSSPFKDWIIDTTKTWAFDPHIEANDALQKLFGASTYTQDEKDAGIKLPGNLASGNINGMYHHPIYEQQEGEVGAAPMFEGSMRDNMLYLFNVAYQVSNLANYGNVLGKNAHVSDAEKVKAQEVIKEIAKMKQANDMKDALVRASKISSQLKARLANMKDYFVSLGAVNETDPAQSATFGLVTVAPGSGESTIQSMSKYSFLYRELGFHQPLPKNLHELAAKADEQAGTSGSLFNMDDNGWWWNLGRNTESITANLNQFAGNMDIAVITARDSDYNDIVTNQQPVRAALKNAIKSVKDTSELPSLKVNYDLWNEGIKTPFVFHMILDDIVARTEKWALSQGKVSSIDQAKKAKALDWGTYFSTEFVQ